MTEKQIIIEDLQHDHPNGLHKTVVRTSIIGIIISTAKSPHYPNEIPDYETKLWPFTGYETESGILRPKIEQNTIESTGLDTEHEFKGLPEEASKYHYEVVEQVASNLEEVLGRAQEGSNL